MIFSAGWGVCNLCHGRKHHVECSDPKLGWLWTRKKYSVEAAFELAAATRKINPALLVTVVHCKTGQESGAIVE